MANPYQNYRQKSLEQEVFSADPHRLIQILMEHGIRRLELAKHYFKEKNIAEKGAHIGQAISIIGGLRESLDFEKGGEIAKNLELLYEYMTRRLLLANLHNDMSIVDEVIRLFSEIKAGWDGIPEQLQKENEAKNRDGNSES